MILAEEDLPTRLGKTDVLKLFLGNSNGFMLMLKKKINKLVRVGCSCFP